MIQLLIYPFVLVLSYFIGSIPFGLLIVKMSTGKDIRTVESGRTGGTNAFRAAGIWAGLSTALLDLLKATVAVWAVQALLPPGSSPINPWFIALAPVAVILGHNYSIFLMGRDETGHFRLRGGAGGAPCVGGSFGLWAPSILVILPVGAVILFGVGYASLATMSVGLISAVVFAYRAWTGAAPWQYALYGLIAEVVLVWSLRPNIQRLLAGRERLIGWRARHN